MFEPLESETPSGGWRLPVGSFSLFVPLRKAMRIGGVAGLAGLALLFRYWPGAVDPAVATIAVAGVLSLFLPRVLRWGSIRAHRGVATGVVTDTEVTIGSSRAGGDRFEYWYMFTGPDGSTHTGYVSDCLNLPAKGDAVEIEFDTRDPQVNRPA